MNEPAIRYLAHAVVGAAVVALLKRTLPTAPAILLGLIVVAAHERYDAPLARVLGELA